MLDRRVESDAHAQLLLRPAPAISAPMPGHMLVVLGTGVAFDGRVEGRVDVRLRLRLGLEAVIRDLLSLRHGVVVELGAIARRSARQVDVSFTLV